MRSCLREASGGYNLRQASYSLMKVREDLLEDMSPTMMSEQLGVIQMYREWREQECSKAGVQHIQSILLERPQWGRVASPGPPYFYFLSTFMMSLNFPYTLYQ